nr:EOG090X0JX7 [Eulimnadia texana]
MLSRLATQIRHVGLSPSSFFQICKNELKTVKVSGKQNFRYFSEQAPWKVNTVPIKDVLLYRYDNTKFIQLLNIFSVSQLIFWTYCMEFTMSTLRDAPVNKDEQGNAPWYKKINLGENKYRNGIAVLCVSLGAGILAGTWFYCWRAVKYLVLRKGGKTVAVVTYAPFAKTRQLEIPLSQISAAQSRSLARVQLPFKVKGRTGHFIVDMRGEFTNGPLFDATVGLRRQLK